MGNGISQPQLTTVYAKVEINALKKIIKREKGGSNEERPGVGRATRKKMRN